jgi:hypothetical protein
LNSFLAGASSNKIDSVVGVPRKKVNPIQSAPHSCVLNEVGLC